MCPEIRLRIPPRDFLMTMKQGFLLIKYRPTQFSQVTVPVYKTTRSHIPEDRILTIYRRTSNSNVQGIDTIIETRL